MPHSVCVVGAGIGEQHCAAYAALPEQFRIHSICDLDEARGRSLADKYGAGYIRAFDAALNNPDIDIIDICLPAHLHFQTSMAALDAGKNVVCEKPLASSLRDVDALEAKVKETGGVLAPVFQYRYGLGTAQLQALINAGIAGECYAGTLETHWNRDAEYYAVDWRGTWAGEQGGALVTHAIHIHDLLTWMIGPVAKIYATSATRVNEIEVEDCAALALTMQNGAPITSSITLGASRELSRLRLMFEGFTVESDHEPYAPASAAWRFEARAPTSQSQIDAVLAAVDPVPAGYVGMFAALAEALDGKGGREVTLADGRVSVEFITAAYASMRSEMPVSLPLGRENPLYEGWSPVGVA